MARSMPWLNAVNKRKRPSYETEKNWCLKNKKKKTVTKAKVYRHCSYISELLVTKWTFFLWKTRKYIFLLLLFILEKKNRSFAHNSEQCSLIGMFPMIDIKYTRVLIWWEEEPWWKRYQFSFALWVSNCFQTLPDL